MTNNLSLRSILDANRLVGNNFSDWLRNLRIVLRQEKLIHIIEKPAPEPPAEDANEEQNVAFQKYLDEEMQVRCLMQASMSPELQRQHEDMNAGEIIMHLKELFGAQSRVERYETSKSLFRCKMAEGSSVKEHVLKMIGYIEKLSQLGFVMDNELSIDLVLQSLPDSYSQFVMNFHMNKLEVSLPELMNMLNMAEGNLMKAKSPVMLMSGASSKRKHMGNGAEKKKPAAKKQYVAKKDIKKPKGTCHHCGKEGHWRRNCKAYLASLKEKRANDSSASGLYVIDVNLSEKSDTSTWVLDTGCGSHICNHVQGLKISRRLEKNEVDLRVGNGAKVAAQAVGSYIIELPTGLFLTLDSCYLVPVLSRNLISVSCLDRLGFYFQIRNGLCTFSYDGIVYGTAKLHDNGLYIVEQSKPINILNVNNKKTKIDKSNDSYLWHCRLGHINETRLTKLHKDGYLNHFDYESYETCESCLVGKMTKSPFKGKGERVADLLALVHTDVCGPMTTHATGGFSYFITFTDDHSRYGYVYLMKYKNEAFEKFKEFKDEVEKQTGKNILSLRSDRGGEYLSDEFRTYLRENGILSQWTPPGTPQHNGVSERRNRTLLDMVRSMMSFTDLPISFWGYALNTAAYLLNRVPSKSVDKTPYEIWSGKKPNLSYLKIWGCDAYVKRTLSNKLDPKSDKCKFVGYPKETIGYYFYNPVERKVIVSKHAVFLEKEFILREDSGSKVELDEVQQQQIDTDHVMEQVIEPQEVQNDCTHSVEPRRTARSHRPPRRYGYLVENGEESIVDHDDPVTYKEAMSDIDSEKWLEAMKSEMDSMYTNQVWTLVDVPEGKVPIGCKWVFKRKTDADGKVNTFKARLVAKGFKQKQGVDFDETFSPVAMLKSIRILLAIAAYHDYEIWQMDVKTAFLNGYLQEEVYMTQPEGFVSIESPNNVCKLNKSIYGLKQASRAWNIRFDETIKGFDFIRNEDEPCVYKKVSGSSIVFLVLYVDDILLIGNDIPMLESVKLWLSKNFSMKDLGEAAYILGIKIYRDRSKRLLGLSQSTYIDKVLKRFKMEESKKGYLPMSHGIYLSKDMCPQTEEEKEHMRKIPYASAIGSIMYAMLCTRPDVSYALSVTSRYQANPGERHWIVVKNILKYLRRTKDVFLIYGGNDLIIRGYTDASFQSDKDDSRSQSGFVFTLNGGAVSWKSSKQDTTADSTTEAEYIAASEAAKEAVWIKKFVTELGVVPDIVNPISVYCDNNGAIAQAKEPRSHQRSKHVLRRYHLIREIIQRNDIKIERVTTDDNLADPFTKALSQKKHDDHKESYGIKFRGDWL